MFRFVFQAVSGKGGNSDPKTQNSKNHDSGPLQTIDFPFCFSGSLRERRQFRPKDAKLQNPKLGIVRGVFQAVSGRGSKSNELQTANLQTNFKQRTLQNKTTLQENCQHNAKTRNA
jgi:hypothetical protein